MGSTIAIVLIKFLLSLALTTGFYLLLFRNKSSFIASRIFLLGSPLICILFSVLKFETELVERDLFFPQLTEKRQAETQPAKTYKTSYVNINKAAESPSVAVAVTPAEESPRRKGDANKSAVKASPAAKSAAEVPHATVSPAAHSGNGTAAEVNPARKFTGMPTVVLSAYLLATLSYLILITLQLRKIRRIRRSALCERMDGYTLFTSGEVRSPFSVMKNIFISPEYSGKRFDIVVAHEKQHIMLRHYMDLLIMEILTVLFWFNPFIWVIRKELRSVHEFQVDDILLKQGIGREKYMRTILEETTGRIPSIANGFNGSLIKRRFIKMRDGNAVRLKALRISMTTPFLLVLIVFLSVTSARKEPSFSDNLYFGSNTNRFSRFNDFLFSNPFVNGNAGIGIPVAESALPPSTQKESPVSGMSADIPAAANGYESVTAGVIEQPSDIISVDTEGENITLHTETPGSHVIAAQNVANSANGKTVSVAGLSYSEDGKAYNPDGVEVPELIVNEIKSYNGKLLSDKDVRVFGGTLEGQARHPRLIGIEASDSRTVIKIVSKVSYQWDWLFWARETCLVDRATGDRYMIRGIEGPMEPGQMAFVHGFDGKYIEHTLIFPPLKDGVNMVDLYEPNYVNLPAINNDGGLYWRDIAIAEFSGAEDSASL